MKEPLTIAASEPLRSMLQEALSERYDVTMASSERDVEQGVAREGVVLLHEHFLGHEAGWELARRLVASEPKARLIVLFEPGPSYRFLYPSEPEFVLVETAQLPMTEDALLYQLSSDPPRVDMARLEAMRRKG